MEIQRVLHWHFHVLISVEPVYSPPITPVLWQWKEEHALLIKLPQPCVYFKLSGGHKQFFFLPFSTLPNKSLSGQRRRGLGRRETERDPALGGPLQPALGRAGAKKINSLLWHWGWAMPLCDRGRQFLVSVTELSLPPFPSSAPITPHQCPTGVGWASRTRGGVRAKHSLHSQPASKAAGTSKNTSSHTQAHAHTQKNTHAGVNAHAPTAAAIVQATGAHVTVVRLNKTQS